MQVYFSKLNNASFGGNFANKALLAKALPPMVLAVGNFDGFHKGHQYLFNKLKAEGKTKGLEPAVLTFEPHPKGYFNKSKLKNRITPLRAKIELFEKYGIKHCFVMRFNNQLANAPAEEFLQHIIYNMNTKLLLTGQDFAFGKNRSGTVEVLQESQARYGYEHIIVPKLTIKSDKEPVSSSLIRQYINAGNITKANEALGRRHFIIGKVAKGQGNGKKLGMPTANLYFSNQIGLKNGVYAVKIHLNNTRYDAVANFGVRPTFAGQKEILKEVLEVHIPNYKGQDFYTQRVKVEFVKFIRLEQKFESLTALKEQIAHDIVVAKELNLKAAKAAELSEL